MFHDLQAYRKNRLYTAHQKTVILRITLCSTASFLNSFALIRFTKNVLFQWTALLLWTLSLIVMYFCTFFRNESLLKEEYDKWGNVLHITFVRPAWAIAMCWVIFACVFGHGGKPKICYANPPSFMISGIINSFLSMSLFQILSRLVYCHYLVHFTAIQIVEYSRRNPLRFSDFQMVN